MQRLRVLAFGIVGLVALTACGSGSGSGSDSSSTKARKIAFIQLQSSPLTSEIALGAESAAKDVGSKVTTQGPATINPPEAIAALRSDVSAGFDGVIADAYPSGLWIKPLADAKRGGLAVASLDAGSPKSVATFHTGASAQGKGSALAKEFSTALGPNAKGYIQPGICVPGLDVLVPIFQGFKEEMAKLQPGVEVKDPYNSTGQPDSNFSAWSRKIAQEPDALGFFGVCDQDAANLLKVKQDNPGAKYLIGNVSGDSVAVVQAVQAGTMTAVVGQNGFVQGYLSAKYMLKSLNDGKGMPNGWVDSGVDVVTKANAAEAISVRQAKNAALYEKYYAKAIAAAENSIKSGHLPGVGEQLTSLNP